MTKTSRDSLPYHTTSFLPLITYIHKIWTRNMANGKAIYILNTDQPMKARYLFKDIFREHLLNWLLLYE